MAEGRLAQTRVGVLGSGEVGRRLAVGFKGCGHEVMLGSRDPGKPELREWVSGDGAGIAVGTFSECACARDAACMAVLGNAAEAAIAEAGPENFSGKVVIDAMNPLDFSGWVPAEADHLWRGFARRACPASPTRREGRKGIQHHRQPVFRGSADQ